MSDATPPVKAIEVFVNRSNTVSIRETNEKGQYGIGDTIAISYEQIDEVINSLKACKKEIEGL